MVVDDCLATCQTDGRKGAAPERSCSGPLPGLLPIRAATRARGVGFNVGASFAWMLAACGSGTMSPADGGGDSASDVGRVAVTWWHDIAPLTERYCAGCHRDDGVAPFSMQTYSDAAHHASLMAGMTEARRMPPWPPATTGCLELINARVLSIEQIGLFRAWSEAGAPEGNRADYVAPMVRMDPFPPTGDITVQPPDPYTPNLTNPADDFHCFVLDPQLTTTRDVIGVRVTPGNGGIVHHMLLFEVRAGGMTQLQQLDDAAPGPGYTCSGGPGVTANIRPAPAGSSELLAFDQQGIAGWGPGYPAMAFPAGTGIRLAPGSRIVMQIHYDVRSVTAAATDRTRVDLYLSPEPVRHPAMWVPESQTQFLVPAGVGPPDVRSRVVASPTNWALPFRIWGVWPHMHQRGHEIRADIQHPDGTSECLIDIPSWNVHAQESFWFRSPARTQSLMGVSSHTTLTCVYDNTPANQPIVDGIQQAPYDLHWGEGGDQEMCLNFYYVSL